MTKTKSHHHFVYLFIALSITLIFTFVLFFALFQLNGLDQETEYEENGVKIVKLSRSNGFSHFESVNKYLREQYRYGLNQFAAWPDLVDNRDPFELKAIKESDYFYVDENTKTLEKDTECTHYTCFDLYHCETHENLIRVYIYPVKNYVLKQNSKVEILNEFSEQYYRILEAIIDSPFYTDNPDRACLYVAPIDTLNDLTFSNSSQVSQAISRLRYFDERAGKNHLFFNFIPNEQHLLSLDLGKAMIAGGGFDTFAFRQRFDLSVPTFSPLSEQFPLQNRTFVNHVLNKNRKWTLLVTQFNLANREQQAILKRFEADKSVRVLLLTNQCRNHNPVRFRCSLNKKLAFNYTQILQSAKFCLITRTRHLASTLLSDALMYGCVPVIAVDDMVLPFSEKLDWARFSVKVHEKQLDNLLNLLKSIDNAALFEMRRQAMLIWYRYFSTIDRITITSLFLINERIFPHTALPKSEWNELSWSLLDGHLESSANGHSDASANGHSDPSANGHSGPSANSQTGVHLNQLAEKFNQPVENYHNSSYFYPRLDVIRSKPASLNVKSPNQGFTAVILAYDRMESLLGVVRMLANVPSCVKILIVWNNQNKPPPSADEFFQLLNSNWAKQIKIPIQIVVTTENKLSNRFYPFFEIETDCVLAIDDDITMLNADELEFTFQVWREFPDRLVGFPSRVHRYDKQTNRWRYESEWTNDVSMILTGAAFYHKFYNYLYTFEMPTEIREWVDQNMNCEDIAMNFLVANITGKAPIKSTPRKKFKCPECINKPMLSSNALSHLNKRSDCINIFARVYGRMPLQTVEFRADPVLYKDNLPEKLKRYIQIGSL